MAVARQGAKRLRARALFHACQVMGARCLRLLRFLFVIGVLAWPLRDALPAAAQSGGPGSLTTTFAGGNGFAGNMFQIVPSVDLIITGFDAHVRPQNVNGPPATVDVYWRFGTVEGHVDSDAGWTLLGTDTAVPPAGNGLPSRVRVPRLFLRAGVTYGFYVHLRSYSPHYMEYTPGAGPVTYSNADLQVITHYGKGTPAFTGQTFPHRHWNGTVYYTTDLPTSVTIEDGTPQAAQIGALFSSLLSVRVRDSHGNGVPEVKVAFAGPGAGAGATLSHTTVVTDSTGIARIAATANGTIGGPYSVTAFVPEIPSVSPAGFSLTNLPIPNITPTTLLAIAGGGQQARVGNAFTNPLIVEVRNSDGAPLSGVNVTFAAPATGAGASLSATAAITDSLGRASINATANAVDGAYVVTASVNGIATPSAFALTNTPEPQEPPPPTPTRYTRYFAEGASLGFFATRISVLNPNPQTANVSLRLLGANGQERTLTRSVAAMERTTFDLDDASVLPDGVFASIIDSNVPVVADRLMTWDDNGYGSHLETSLSGPSTTWYLAEGATGGPFSLFYLLQNPGDTQVDVTVRYLLPAPQVPVVKTYQLEPHSRFTIDVAGEDAALASATMSAQITSTQPIVVERSMYASTPSQFLAAGHGGAGIAAPATRWFLAEGATAFFDEYVLIANAEADDAQLRVTYLVEGGESFSETLTVARNSRHTIDVSNHPRLSSAIVSTIVESTNLVPIVVERVMWWPRGGNWYEATVAAGATTTGTKWALADAEQGGPNRAQTFILIANTDPVNAGQATVSFVYDDGSRHVKKVALQPNSRTTIDAGAFKSAVNRKFSVIVESDGVAIVVERALYHSVAGVLWAAGAASVATNLSAP